MKSFFISLLATLSSPFPVCFAHLLHLIINQCCKLFGAEDCLFIYTYIASSTIGLLPLIGTPRYHWATDNKLGQYLLIYYLKTVVT